MALRRDWIAQGQGVQSNKPTALLSLQLVTIQLYCLLGSLLLHAELRRVAPPPPQTLSTELVYRQLLANLAKYLCQADAASPNLNHCSLPAPEPRVVVVRLAC